MRIKTTALILAICVFLSACGETAGSFELKSFGEVFAADNAVYCLTDGDISLYTPDGELAETAESTENYLCHDSAGNYALAFGEHDIFLSNGKAIKHNYIKNKIMSTSIKQNGCVAVCAEEAGYKGAVTVYDENFTPIYKWYCASGIIIKAALSEKNILAVLTANESGSTAHVFAFDSENELCSVTVPKTLCIDLCFMNETLCLLSETAAYFADGEKITETVPFDRPLGEYALTENFAFLEFCNGDGTSELICLDAKGNEKGSADREMLRGLAANENAVAVLCGSDAVLFDGNLKEFRRADAKGVRSVLLCGDDMLLLRDGNIIAYSK